MIFQIQNQINLMSYVYEDKSLQNWLHFIRHEEAIAAMKLFPTGNHLKILEIGGGDGYIASIFAERGYIVTSIDISPRYPQHFPVQEVAGDKLSFPDENFDIVFSSNVLEHVVNLRVLLSEIKRVAKKDAVIIHTMPSPAWRLLTTFFYIFRLILKGPLILISHLKGNSENENVSGLLVNEKDSVKKTYIKKLRNIILHPHGNYPSFFHEIYYFSRKRWLKVFMENNFKITHTCKCPLMYSGYFVFKFKFVSLRRKVAEDFFSAGYIYIMINSDTKDIN